MEVTVMQSDGLKREFRIVVPAQDVEREIEEQLKDLGRRTRLPGFRPGRIPLSVLKQRFGKSVIPDVVDHLVQHSSQHALADRGMRPALRPDVEIESYAQGEDLAYRMKVEILPDIEPVDLSTIEVVRLEAPVGEEDVDAALRRLAARAKRFVAVGEPRPARKGDLLVIDYEGKADGEGFEGGRQEGRRVELGSNTLPFGFEEQLVGAKAGDRVRVRVTVPEEARHARLAGKALDFDVEVRGVEEPAPVVIDDRFAREAGAADLADLKETIRKRLEREFEAESRLRLRRRLFDALDAAHDFAFPEGLVEREFESIWRQVANERKGETESPEGKNEDASRAEYRAIAVRRVKLGLLLSEIGRLNDITLTDDEVNQALWEEARKIPGREQQVVEFYRRTPEALASFRAPLFEEKVVDFILKNVKIGARSVTSRELFHEEEESSMAALRAKAKKTAGKTATKPVAKKKTAKKPAAKRTAAKKR